MPVLVIEDEDEIREDVAGILRDEGYDVVTASNGAEGLARLKGTDQPCLILLDLMMPVMDGAEFRAAQVGDPSVAAVPVVIVSGAGNARQRASDLRAAGYLLKPFRIRDLLETVARFCSC